MADELETAGKPAQADTDAEKAGGNEAGKAADAAKPDGEVKGGESAKDDGKQDAGKPPESYDLKLADGSLLKPEDLERIKAEAKEKGLTNEAAQELVDREGRTLAAYHEGLVRGFESERDSWIRAAEADKEIGGEAFKENVEISKRLLKEVASKDFYEKVLAPKADGGLGLGDHPEMVRIFTRLARRGFAEDKTVHSGKGKTEEASLEKRLYPDLK